jgi:hypothetical protein
VLHFRKVARQAKQEAISQNFCLLRIREKFLETAKYGISQNSSKIEKLWLISR